MPWITRGTYGIEPPAPPRYDLFEVFLTGIASSAKVDVDGDPATPNPLDVDLNSQALNAGAAEFQPSEMLRLNMSITKPTGLDGKPLDEASRRPLGKPWMSPPMTPSRLADDVVDIELLALEGIYDVSNVPADRQAAFDALKDGDRVPRNDAQFSDTFPYLAAPETDAVNVPDRQHASGAAAAAAGGGGIGGTWLPAVTGSVAFLLIAAGGISLLRGRSTAAKGMAGAKS